MLEVGVITREYDLKLLESEWEELAQLSESSTVFQSYVWIAEWWKWIGRKRPDRQLRVLVFRQSGTLVGIAPFVLGMWHGTPLRRLQFAASGVSDYHDILAAPGWEEAVVDALYRTLSARMDWHVADFANLGENAILRRKIPNPGPQLTGHEYCDELCPYLSLHYDGSPAQRWESLLSTYSHKRRAGIRYQDRSILRVFNADYSVVTTEQDVRETMSHLFTLHQRRWNSKWLPGVFAGSRIRRFHLEAATKLNAQSVLRLHRLTLDEEVQGVLYAFACNGRTLYYQSGFEPTLSKYGLGTVLIAAAIRYAMGEGHKELDFLRGDESYKQLWTKGGARRNLRIVVTRSKPWVDKLVSWSVQVEDQLEACAKRWARSRSQMRDK